jgi:hypothetical protein
MRRTDLIFITIMACNMITVSVVVITNLYIDFVFELLIIPMIIANIIKYFTPAGRWMEEEI